MRTHIHFSLLFFDAIFLMAQNSLSNTQTLVLAT
jgi:hypothetical protein